MTTKTPERDAVIERLRTEKDHVVMRARIHAQEARTANATILGILRRLSLPPHAWEAESLVRTKTEQASKELSRAWESGRDAAAEVVKRKAGEQKDQDYDSECGWAAQVLGHVEEEIRALRPPASPPKTETDVCLWTAAAAPEPAHTAGRTRVSIGMTDGKSVRTISAPEPGKAQREGGL